MPPAPPDKLGYEHSGAFSSLKVTYFPQGLVRIKQSYDIEPETQLQMDANVALYLLDVLIGNL